MLSTVESPQMPHVWQPPECKPLDEAVWRTWIEKGERRELRSNAARLMAIKCAAISALLAAAALGSLTAPQLLILNCVVALSALAVMRRAIQQNQHEVAALFTAIAALYNPVIPLLAFSGESQRLLLAASTVPFIISLVGTLRKEHR